MAMNKTNHIKIGTVQSVLIILTLMLSISYSHAYQVQPLVAEMLATGPKSQLSMRVNNTGNDPVSIEILPTIISVMNDGAEKRTPAESDILVLPVTAVISPGKSQSFVVKYIGEPDLDHSKTYRISFIQTNIDLGDENETGIGLGVNFHPLISVIPKGAKPHLKIIDQKLSPENSSVTIKNTGNRYARLSKTEWVVSDKSGKRYTLAGDSLKEHVSGSFLMEPGTTHTYIITTPKNINTTPVSISISPTE